MKEYLLAIPFLNELIVNNKIPVKRRSEKKGSSLHSKGKLKELRKLYKLEQ